MAVDYEMEALEKEVEELNKKHFSQETSEDEVVVEEKAAEEEPTEAEGEAEAEAEAETVAEEEPAAETQPEGEQEQEQEKSKEESKEKASEGRKEEPVNIYEKRYNDLRPWTTRVSQENAALKAELDSMKKYIESIKPNLPKEEDVLEAAMAPLKEEYEDLADVLAPALDKVVKNYFTPLKAELDLLRQKAIQGDNVSFDQAVRSVHENFDTVVSSQEFNEWLAGDSKFVPAKVKVAMYNDSDPQSAIKLIDLYKTEVEQEHKTETIKKESHERVVKQAAQALAEPKAGGSNPHTLAVTEKKSKFGTLADVVNMDNDYYEKHAAEILADINAGILR